MVDAFIEISMNSNIKYEFDKDLDCLRLDRILNTSMMYPANYGYFPETLADDGDALDVLVLSNYQIQPGVVIKVKIIGVLIMYDEKGKDEKIITVPDSSVDPDFTHFTRLEQVGDPLLNKIKHFFQNYKELEKNKWVKIENYDNGNVANQIYNNAKLKYIKENETMDDS